VFPGKQRELRRPTDPSPRGSRLPALPQRRAGSHSPFGSAASLLPPELGRESEQQPFTSFASLPVAQNTYSGICSVGIGLLFNCSENPCFQKHYRVDVSFLNTSHYSDHMDTNQITRVISFVNMFIRIFYQALKAFIWNDIFQKQCR